MKTEDGCLRDTKEGDFGGHYSRIGRAVHQNQVIYAPMTDDLHFTFHLVIEGGWRVLSLFKNPWLMRKKRNLQLDLKMFNERLRALYGMDDLSKI